MDNSSHKLVTNEKKLVTESEDQLEKCKTW